MSTTVSYKGATIATVSNDTKTLLTEGKYLEDDITLTDVSGGGAVLGTKSISENGTYEAEDDSLDGYSEVTVAVPASAVDSGTKSITANGNNQDVVGYAAVNVNVPNTYSAGDEGKVVDNGALVAQGSDTVTENDTYDTTLINSLTVNVSGGGGAGVATCFRVDNYYIPSNKWATGNALPNYLADGGCVHMTFTLPTNTSTSADYSLICFGTGNLSAWSLANTECGGYILVTRNSKVINFQMRGAASNQTLQIDGFANEDDLLDMKFYADKYVDVNTGTEYTYTSSQQAFFNVLSEKDYISVGINQSNPLVGALIDLFAIEAS